MACYAIEYFVRQFQIFAHIVVDGSFSFGINVFGIVFATVIDIASHFDEFEKCLFIGYLVLFQLFKKTSEAFGEAFILLWVLVVFAIDHTAHVVGNPFGEPDHRETLAGALRVPNVTTSAISKKFCSG